MLPNQGSQVIRLQVVLGSAVCSRSAERRSGNTDEDLGVGRRGVGDVVLPVVVVDGAVGRAARVVVELHPEVIELSFGDDLVHVGLGDGALRSAGDVVRVGRVRGKVGSQLGNHELVVLVAAVALNVKVPPVDKGRSERARHAAVALAVAVGVPEVLADGLCFFLRRQGVRARRSAQRHDDLDAVGLARVDGLGEVVALLALARGGNGAGLADGPGGNLVAVAVLVQEGQDNHVNACFAGAVGRQIVVLNHATAILAPVDDILSAVCCSRLHASWGSRSRAGQQTEASEGGEEGMHLVVKRM